MQITPNPDDARPHHRSYQAYYRYHYLVRRNWLLGRNNRISFPGHGTNVVTCLLFDDEKILSGSDDQTIHVYDIKKGELVKKLVGHDGGVWALQYHGNTVVSGSTDRSVRLWDLESGKCTHIFEGHTSTVRCLVIVPQDGSDILPMTSQGQPDFTRYHTNGAVRKTNPYNPALEPARFQKWKLDHTPLIVTGSRDNTIRVWRLPDPEDYKSEASQALDGSPPLSGQPYHMHTLAGHTSSVRAITGQGPILVSGSYDSSVRIWNIVEGRNLHVCNGHRGKVYSVGYSHELNRAASGSVDATVRVWDTLTGANLFVLEGHESLVGLLELTPQYIVSAAADSTLRIWCPMTGVCHALLKNHNAAITCFQHDPATNRIISGSDGGVKTWELSAAAYAGFPLHAVSSLIPSSSPVARQVAFSQGQNGPSPAFGRYVGDAISDVTGVWRTRMNAVRMVSAVQNADDQT
ncbi:SCF ubiquitin ligase complex subunit cdc4, partial [Kappamyces sp. JEL0680]